MSNKRKFWAVLLILFVLGAAGSAGALVYQNIQQRSRLRELEELAQNTVEEEAPPVIETTMIMPEEPVEEEESDNAGEPLTLEEKIQWYKDTYDIEVPEKDLDFTDLCANTNPDIYAWIYIPNTKIDYPVLQHSTDNTYYLNYNIDGSKGYPGCIYTENYNVKDFTDPLTVMYGHNMKNGSMFANLHLFEDAEFFEENPYIFIYLEDDVLVYEIFSAGVINDDHLLYNKDYSNETEMEKYLMDSVTRSSMSQNVRDDLELTAQNKVLALSTCIANRPNNRYLVQGVLLDEN